MEDAIAIIPARGGSKRIPRKNIRPFCGRPIIAYSIEAAIKSGVFSEVMVSTDDEEIAEIARKEGASVPFLRSAETSGDHATSSDALLEVLSRYEEAGRTFLSMVCIYATAPFVTPEKLRQILKELKEHDCVEAIPVAPFPFPPQRAFTIDEKGCASYLYPEHALTRSQDLTPLYHDIGQYYAYDVAAFRAANGVINDKKRAVITEPYEVQDIDTEEDWRAAELKYRILREAAASGEAR